MGWLGGVVFAFEMIAKKFESLAEVLPRRGNYRERHRPRDRPMFGTRLLTPYILL